MGNQKVYALVIAVVAALLVMLAGKSCADNISENNKNSQNSGYYTPNADRNSPQAEAHLATQPNGTRPDKPAATTTFPVDYSGEVNTLLPQGTVPSGEGEPVTETTTKQKTVLEKYWERQEQNNAPAEQNNRYTEDYQIPSSINITIN